MTDLVNFSKVPNQPKLSKMKVNSVLERTLYAACL